METIWMIQKAAARGNCWLGASSQQHDCSWLTPSAEFFGETSNHLGDSAPVKLNLVPCDFWLFPKLKSTLKGKRFQTIDEIQENMMGQLMVIGRTVKSQGAIFEGDWGIPVLCTFLVSSSIYISIFSYYMARYLLDRLHIYIYTN